MYNHRYISLLIAIFMACIPAFGFSQQVDSLKQALRYDAEYGTIIPDTTNINSLVKIAASFGPTQGDSTLKYARKALSISRKLDYISGIFDASKEIGNVYLNQGHHQKLLQIANRLLLYLDVDGYEQEKGYVNHTLGNAYSLLGNYQLGLKYYSRARNLYKKVGDQHGALLVTNNIGVTYLDIKEYKKARDIYLKIDTAAAVNENNVGISLNLGTAYLKLGEYEKARMQINREVEYGKASNDLITLAYAYSSLGDVYRAQGINNKAVNYYKKSIQASDSVQNVLLKEPALNGIAEIYLKEAKTDAALTHAQKAFTIGEKNNSVPAKNNAAEILYKIYNAMGKPEMALKYHVLHKTFSDSLFNDEISREIGRLEAKNKFEKRELALKEQQKQESLENEKRVAEHRTYLAILAALLLASMIGAYTFYRNGKVRKATNNLLKEKNDEIKSQTRQLKELNEVKSHLFSIISHDLRGPISSLSGIINLHDMNSLSPGEIEIMMGQVAQKFKYTSSLLTNLLSWSRSQLEGYHTEPVNFDLKKLADAVLPVATSKARDKNISVANDIDHAIPVYADRNMMELVLLNLLSNAVKFTPQSGCIALSASMSHNSVEVCVSDTGVGIPEDKVKLLLKNDSFYSTKGTQNEKGTGLGLMLCKDFIEKNNGTLNIQSSPEAGSTFCFTIPAGEDEIQITSQFSKRAL